tara:strand:- start:3283 stop:3528 length:246 start_codon:yes stop_codon:yes gene_type:complete
VSRAKKKVELLRSTFFLWQGHVEYPQIYHRRVQKSKLSCPAPRYRTTILRQQAAADRGSTLHIQIKEKDGRKCPSFSLAGA